MHFRANSLFLLQLTKKSKIKKPECQVLQGIELCKKNEKPSNYSPTGFNKTNSSASEFLPQDGQSHPFPDLQENRNKTEKNIKI